jgi:predicted DsbA family dithiol-disulfide isomerase
VEVDYRAFELRPEPVPTLDPKGEYLRRVWGQSVYPLAEQLGVPIRLPSRQPRSRLAFEAAELARECGKLAEWTRAAYEAFFHKDRDISDTEVLKGIAREVGLDEGELVEVLTDHRYLADVLEQEGEAARIGVDAVPMTLVGPHALPGLVPYETLVRAVELTRAGG